MQQTLVKKVEMRWTNASFSAGLRFKCPINRIRCGVISRWLPVFKDNCRVSVERYNQNRSAVSLRIIQNLASVSSLPAFDDSQRGNTLDGVSNAFYGLLWRFFSNIHQNMPIGRDQGILGDKKNTQVKAYRLSSGRAADGLIQKTLE